eukprot:Colp12_sorted_trinity150504_noHs@34210
MAATTMNHVFSFILVALVWGTTNPFLKYASEGLNDIKKDSPTSQFFAQLFYMVTTWQYAVSWLLNQSGSVLYFWTLSESDITLASPIANSLTMAVTTVVGSLLFKETLDRKAIAGVALILAGTWMCSISKLQS